MSEEISEEEEPTDNKPISQIFTEEGAVGVGKEGFSRVTKIITAIPEKLSPSNIINKVTDFASTSATFVAEGAAKFAENSGHFIEKHERAVNGLKKIVDTAATIGATGLATGAKVAANSNPAFATAQASLLKALEGGGNNQIGGLKRLVHEKKTITKRIAKTMKKFNRTNTRKRNKSKRVRFAL